MEGYRVTESGDSRVSESGEFRITEGFLEGLASLNGTGTLSSLGNLKTYASVSLTTDGSVLLAGQSTLFGKADLQGIGSVSSTANTKRPGSAALESSGAVSSTGTRVQYAFSSLAGQGSISAKGGFKSIVFASIQAEGTLSGFPHYIAQGLFESITIEYTRITEDGNTRITESGDTRVLDNKTGNTVEGSIVAFGTRVPFSSDLYIKNGGTWKAAIPFAKYNSQWVEPISIYRKYSTGWKRIK